MKLRNTCFVFFFVGMIIQIIGCSDDDASKVTGEDEIVIKKLQGYDPITIIKSSFGINGEALTEASKTEFSQTPQGELVIFMGTSEEGTFSQTSAGVNKIPDGKFNYIGFNGNVYRGEDFNVVETSYGYELTGSGNQIEGGAAQDVPMKITISETHIGSGSSTLEVLGDIAKLNGELGSLAYNQVLDLNANHDNVHTILLENVPGSVNDEVNVRTGRLVREAGYKTKVTIGSEISSGGVDFFCAGKYREIEGNAKVGVHSWCCGPNGEEAWELSEADPAHNTQISYFTEMLGNPNGKDFYFFTVNAAKHEDMHLMTEAEIKKYGLETTTTD